MRLKRTGDITMENHCNRPSQTAARTKADTQILKQAKTEMLLSVGIYHQQKCETADPEKQFDLD
jgi:hypothetical protein